MASPMVRSMYTSADMEEDLSITLEPMDRFKHMRGPFGVFFKADPMVRSLYTSADMEEDLSITLELMDGLRHMGGQFGVVFHAQSNGEVTVQIS